MSAARLAAAKREATNTIRLDIGEMEVTLTEQSARKLLLDLITALNPESKGGNRPKSVPQTKPC